MIILESLFNWKISLGIWYFVIGRILLGLQWYCNNAESRTCIVQMTSDHMLSGRILFWFYAHSGQDSNNLGLDIFYLQQQTSNREKSAKLWPTTPQQVKSWKATNNRKWVNYLCDSQILFHILFWFQILKYLALISNVKKLIFFCYFVIGTMRKKFRDDHNYMNIKVWN